MKMNYLKNYNLTESKKLLSLLAELVERDASEYCIEEILYDKLYDLLGDQNTDTVMDVKVQKVNRCITFTFWLEDAREYYIVKYNHSLRKILIVRDDWYCNTKLRKHRAIYVSPEEFVFVMHFRTHNKKLVVSQ